MNGLGSTRTRAAFARRLLPGAILILPGCVVVGAAVGQMLDDPANWTTVGLWLGAVIWGMSLRRAVGASRSD